MTISTGVPSPIGLSPSEPSQNRRRNIQTVNPFTDEEVTYLKKVFKDVKRIDLHRSFVLSRHMDEEFKTFCEQKVENTSFTMDSLADEIIRSLKA